MTHLTSQRTPTSAPHSAHALLTRRGFLTRALLTACALGSGGTAAALPQLPVTVRTPDGTLRGEQTGSVRVFRGVPFAQPPVGPRRFLPPGPVTPWAGVRDATRFAASAMQGGGGHSEDCLYLNVWTPDGPGPFPVFVWIHGGGFTGGASFDPTTDGTQFAREGIIVVTVAYRLGVFGFLDLGPLLGASYAGSADNALRDLIAALGWVRRSIGAFGGDPDRVTIGGESAGAKLTDMLMGLPSAQPLFHQMISESGGAEREGTVVEAAEVAEGFSAQWRAGGASLDALRTAPAADLIAAQDRFLAHWPRHFPLRPEIDGALMPWRPIETIAAGSTRGKRLLIGTNRDESALFIGPHPDHDPTASDLANLPLSVFDPRLARYADIYPTMADSQRRVRAVTAEEYWVPSVRVADAHVRGGGQAWMYRLDFTETSGHQQGEAYHSLDVGLVWDKPHADVANAAAEAALATQVHAAWAAFLRGATPSAPGLPPWPQYHPADRATLVLDTQSRVETRPQDAELHFWDGVL